MRNYTLLWGGKPTKVEGLYGGHTRLLLNRKGIIEVTVDQTKKKTT